MIDYKNKHLFDHRYIKMYLKYTFVYLLVEAQQEIKYND